jgi:hypothetical protein
VRSNNMNYVDGFVLPVPTKNLAKYRRIARLAAKVWREHGALAYVECLGAEAPRPSECSRHQRQTLGEAGLAIRHEENDLRWVQDPSGVLSPLPEGQLESNWESLSIAESEAGAA